MSAGLGSSLPLLGAPLTSGGSTPPLTGALDNTFRFEDKLVAVKRYNVESDLGVGVAPALSYAFRPGAIISEVVRIQQSSSQQLSYTWTIAEQIYMAQSLNASATAILQDGVGVAPATQVALGVALLQSIGIAPTPLPSLRYTQTLVETMTMSSRLDQFIGALLGDGIGVAPALSTKYRPQQVLADGIGIAPVLTAKATLAVVVDDSLAIDDASIIKMIYDGRLADGVQIIVGYISPDGNFSTWAMNTRTAAVTEYTNYAFNSFATIGGVSYGASSSGLYKLVGDTDDGADIIADIQSGFAQWAGTRLALLRGVYIGARGGGDFVLKIITGDGKTYIYTANTRNQATTKIVVGKGLRTRYVSFELISSGQDFDLDTIEFVPLVTQRRV